jgi:hypothetical protein
MNVIWRVKIPKRGRFQKMPVGQGLVVYFHRRYFVSLFEQSRMQNRLKPAKTSGITERFASGM